MSLESLSGITTGVGILLAPGMLLRIVGRLPLMPALALGGTAAVAVIGGSGVVASAAGIPFGPWVLGVVALVVIGAALVSRRGRLSTEPGRATVISVLALAVGTAVVVLTVAGPLLTAGQLALNYDGVFHLNAVARILDTGDASSFTLYRLANPGNDVEYYPAAWHALVALVCQVTGVSIPVATGAAWIATSTTIWLPGVAWLAAALVPQRAPLAAAVGAILGAAFAAAPYGLLSWGTLYPTGLAYALLPVGIALLLRLTSIDTPLWSRRRLASAAAFATWLVAEAFAHPRSLLTFAVIAVPLLLGLAVRLLLRLARRPGGRQRAWRIGIGGASAVLLVGATTAYLTLSYFGAFSEPIADRLTGPPARATQTTLAAIVQVVAQAPPVSPFDTTTFPALGLAALVIIGFVLSARQGTSLWLPIAFVLLGGLYVAAASSDSDLAKLLTGFWYKDKYRLITALPVLAIPAAAAGAVWLLDRIGRLTGVVRRAALVAAAVVVVVATAVPGLIVVREAIGAMFTIPAEKNGYALLDGDEYRLLQRLPEIVPEGESIVGNPWNGSAFTWAIGEREALYPHLTGNWGPDRDLVAAHLDLAADDPSVCAALQRLGAHYLFASAGLLGGGDATTVYWAGVDRAPTMQGFTEVAREGASVLYRISACD